MNPLRMVLAGLLLGAAGVVQGFTGPPAGWASVREYGARGDGKCDDTAALQKALDDLRREDRPAAVLYLPAGTYRITRMLELARGRHEESKDVGIVGEDPRTTRIEWHGEPDGVMFLYNAWYSRMGRLTLDGRDTAGTAIRHGQAFTTYNEFADMEFRNVGFGIEAGVRDGIAETTVRRCGFVNCSRAAVSIQNFNSLDWFLWQCRFEHCRLGVTNVFGAGNFHVYDSVFRESIEADISIGNTCYFAMRDNVSVGSKAFFVAGGIEACGHVTLQGNVIIDAQDAPVQMGNLGPFLLLDNVFKSRNVPAVRVNPKAGFVSAGNTFAAGDPIAAKPGFVRFDDVVKDYDTVKAPVREPADFAARSHRMVIEVSPGAGSAALHEAVVQASRVAGGQAVVHLRRGAYNVDRTLVIPAGSTTQIVGDGPDTVLCWAGEGAGPVVRFEGPSRASMGELSIDGGRMADGVLISGCDVPSARIFMDQTNVGGAQTGYLIERIAEADVAMCNINHGGNRVGVRVVGPGSRSAAGVGAPRAVIYSGASSNNEISYEVLQGGELLARDIWYESGEHPRFLRCTGSGAFTLHGAMVATARRAGVPAVEVDGFKGDLVLLTTILHTGSLSVPVVVTERSGEATVLALGLQVGMGDDYWLDSSGGPAVAMLESFQYTQGGGARPIADRGKADVETIRRLLAPTRAVHCRLDTGARTGTAEIRLERVIVNNVRTGINVTP